MNTKSGKHMSIFKIITFILYLLVIFIIANFVFISAKGSRDARYYNKDVYPKLENSVEEYMDGVFSMSNLIYEKTPIRTIQRDDGSNSINMNIYACASPTVIKPNASDIDLRLTALNTIAIFATDLKFNNENVTKYKVIVKYDSDHPLMTEKDKTEESIDFEISMSSNTLIGVFQIKTGLSKETLINSIEIRVNDDNNLLHWTRNTIGSASINNKFIIDKTSANPLEKLDIVYDDYSVRTRFEGNTPTNEEKVALNLGYTKADVSKYDFIIWRNMIIFALIALVITFLLFFLKPLRNHFIEKKETADENKIISKKNAINSDVPTDKKDDTTKGE